MNKVILIGRLGQDPVYKEDIGVCNFSIADSKKQKDKDGNLQDVTQWFNISAWKETASFCSKWLTKGRQVYIEGTISVRLYTAKDGTPKVSMDVNAIKVEALGEKPSDGTEQDYTKATLVDLGEVVKNTAEAIRPKAVKPKAAAPVDEDFGF